MTVTFAPIIAMNLSMVFNLVGKTRINTKSAPYRYSKKTKASLLPSNIITPRQAVTAVPAITVRNKPTGTADSAIKTRSDRDR